MTVFYITKRRSASGVSLPPTPSLPPGSHLSRHGASYTAWANMGCLATTLATQAQRGAWSRVDRAWNLASTARIARRSRASPLRPNGARLASLPPTNPYQFIFASKGSVC